MLLNEYLRNRFGCKVYKIALNGGFTCPNRDGTIDTRGCIFCSEGGSGEFAESPELSIHEQIERGKKRVESKIGVDGKYIAYFQAFTGTYAPVEKLEKLYTEAIGHPDVVALSIATRPDCIGSEVMELLSKINKIKPVWVELGLQTIHEKTAEYIRRGYKLSVYDECVRELKERGIEVITHVILGLPGETKEDMVETVKYVCGSGSDEGNNEGSDEGNNVGDDFVCNPHADGIKLQLLHILKGTDLCTEYEEGRIEVLSEDEYIDILKACVEVIPKDDVIHRLTGDGDKRMLVPPLWSGNKKHAIKRINMEVMKEGTDFEST